MFRFSSVAFWLQLKLHEASGRLEGVVVLRMGMTVSVSFKTNRVTYPDIRYGLSDKDESYFDLTGLHNYHGQTARKKQDTP